MLFLKEKNLFVIYLRREERQLQKSLEAEKWAFKQKQEKELQVHI